MNAAESKDTGQSTALGRIALAAILLAFAAVSVEARHHHARGSDSTDAGHFDYYVLSLSWAPTYCLTHRDDGSECGSKGYGFVLHGLWPQFDAGGYPEHCQTSYALSPEAVAEGKTLYPSEKLMEHEWWTHGACSGLDALAYFTAADHATAAVKIPKGLEPPQVDQKLTPAQILGMFQSENPRLSAGAAALICSRGSLSELRLCLTKDLVPRSCGKEVRTSCAPGPMRIPGSR